MKDVQKYETLIEDIVLDSDSLQVTTCHTKAAKYLTLAEIVAKEESEIKGKGIDEFCKIAITYVNLANSISAYERSEIDKKVQNERLRNKMY
jgi:hypothetical protein